MPPSPVYRPSLRQAELGEPFYDIVRPAEFPQHILRYRNQRWAARVGLDTLTDAEWIDHFARFVPLPQTFPKPLALRYHGHQFRVYNPDIGDGRGFLFAQLYDWYDGRLLDLGTKGSGRTPYSRTADGRLTLKGGVREILAAEMLEALGVDTSKTFSLIETGEELTRGDEPSPTRSSVLVRLSHSHIRIGSFQRFRALGETANVLRLLNHTVQTYMPEVWREDLGQRAIGFLETVCARVARTGANWLVAGFVHGVLNSDNINVTGESFDYGPWRFLPTNDPTFTAAYFDQTGLYAFGRQPEALQWNLTRLAECLLPFASQADLEKVLGTFETTLHKEFVGALLRRLGLAPAGEESDGELARTFWAFLAETQAPFEQTFFDCYGGLARVDHFEQSPSRLFYQSEGFVPLHAALAAHKPAPRVRVDHPYFQRSRPCTMLIDEVEALWKPIMESNDWSALDAKLADIAEMREAYGAEKP
jgi:uncharacterized protein YdiU (UPF0061 family)